MTRFLNLTHTVTDTEAMHRLIIILSILPILAALFCRKFFADRVFYSLKQETLRISAYQLARGMLDSMDQEQIDIKKKKLSWAGLQSFTKDTITLSPDIADNPSANAHGKAALEVGLFLLSQRSPAITARRQWAVRFGQVFPIFTIVVAIFAVVVAKLNPGWILTVVVASLAAASCAQILTLMANKQAADLASVILNKKRLFPRLHDEETVITATKAWAWRGIVPGILSRFM